MYDNSQGKQIRKDKEEIINKMRDNLQTQVKIKMDDSVETVKKTRIDFSKDQNKGVKKEEKEGFWANFFSRRCCGNCEFD